MMTDKQKDGGLTARSGKMPPRVIRTQLSPVDHYSEYENQLRVDFFFSCAYCTILETEAQGIRFVIDHYEPKRARPDLENEYSNLMYACDPCNALKGDRSPPASAREKGYKFFKADEDIYEEHFELQELTLKHLSNTGYYSIEALELNRLSLRRIRDIRKRLTQCDELVTAGILALRNFHIDRLPKHVRGKAASTINGYRKAQEELVTEIDGILRAYARSPLLDLEDDSTDQGKERLKKLKELKRLYPGCWSGRETPRAKRD